MRILFLCTGNTCRSPMAEGILKLLAAKKNLNITCESAGLCTHDGLSASENAISCMREINVDISHHKSRQLKPEMLMSADCVFVMTDAQKKAIEGFCGRVRVLSQEGIPDPYGGGSDVYRACRDQIKQALLKWVGEGFFNGN